MLALALVGLYLVGMQAPALLESKKFLAAAIASGLGYLCLRSGMSYADAGFIVGPLLAFVGAQGLADLGKARAQTEADSAAAARADNNRPITIGQDALLKVLGSRAPAPTPPTVVNLTE